MVHGGIHREVEKKGREMIILYQNIARGPLSSVSSWTAVEESSMNSHQPFEWCYKKLEKNRFVTMTFMTIYLHTLPLGTPYRSRKVDF